MFAFGETVQIQSHIVGVEDAHGNPIETWAAPVPSDGWAFNPGGSVESYEPGRSPVVSTPQLFRQSNDVIPGSRDRITVRGLLYEVQGDTADWRNPFSGWEPGIVVNLERAAG